MKRNINILLILLLFSKLSAQLDCSDSLAYEQSQIWVNETNLLNAEDKKSEILSRIFCEQTQGLDKVRFRLTFLMEGLLVCGVPEYRNEIIQQIDANEFKLINSLCETEGIFPEKCNLGFLIITGLEKPVINKIQGIEILKIRRKKGRIWFILKSREAINITIIIENFTDKQSGNLTIKKALKKGNNKVGFAADNNLKFIEIQTKDNKTVLLK